MPRRYACLGGALAVLLGCAPAAGAQQPRIIGGNTASAGEYPAQGYLRLQTSSGVYTCGGTLIAARQFLTAAHCATQPGTETPLAPDKFTVRLGSLNRNGPDGTVHAVSANRVHEAYDAGTLHNDAALLTLSAPGSGLTPLPLITTAQTTFWEPDDIATVIGWGKTDNTATNNGSNVLLEASVPMRSDDYCAGPTIYGQDFDPAMMVCAGDASHDTCAGDSGGPLMVSDGTSLRLAGITSWGDLVCAHPTNPGVYTRVGAPALNAWVRAGRSELDFSQAPASPTAGDTVTFTAASADATAYTWDLDADGQFDDASGTTAGRSFAGAGTYPVAVRASDAESQPAERRRRVSVAAVPGPTPTPTAEPTPQPTAQPTPAPTAPAVVTPPPAGPATDVPLPRGPLATILAARRPKVGEGRFGIRVHFARSAPAGTAVVEVIRARRVIGIARARVLRGGTKRIRVKLTPSGRRQLVRSRSGRLTLKVRVRVGRRVLRSKTLTVRR